ncbi:nucleolar complex protein 2 homolog [Astyanax mexicanus]|uniref:Uncharacterized protein n=1 Tax=Astyanax mexicanus TaxID=7994 RepID=A0A8T2MG22_ASTMX|nr:nucleolar complex protein 2 homolog [Astyanax mexicanus]KAG9282969.1 hypothetical protein AMEX_G1682 [Astyanax mexicanus]
MAASELRAELRYRDGETKKFTIKTENSLKSVISSVKKLSAEVSEVLTDLVEQEKSLTGRDNADSRVDGEEEDDDDDSDEHEDEKEKAATVEIKSNSGGPPAKRRKASKP